MTLDPFNSFLHLDPQPGDGGPVIAMKDVIDVAGMPTTAASKVLYRLPLRTPSALRGCGQRARRSPGSSTPTSLPSAR